MATWGRADQCQGAAVLGAVAKLLPPPPAGAPGPFALTEEGVLAALLDAAGFETHVVVDVSTPLV
jgi:hypothetical protein